MKVQNKAWYLILAGFIMILAIIIGSSISLAKPSKSEEVTYKYYTTIRVEQGDTLWSIAAEHMTDEYDEIWEYIAEVRKLNHLNSNRIYDGKYLTIPYYSPEILE